MPLLPKFWETVYINLNFAQIGYEETELDILRNCVVPSIESVLPTILKLILSNVLFGCLLSTGLISLSILHLLSGSIGIYTVSTINNDYGKLILLGCWIISFILLRIGYYLRQYLKISVFLKITIILLLILCEYYLIEPYSWLQIRGIVMVLVMKVISLGDDLENLNSMPHFTQYFGYTLCGANVMFGPWISFNDYLNFYKKPTKKNLIWICAIVKIFTTSLFFLSVSNCWCSFYISDDSNRWLTAYKEALSFRTGHYFISYLAELGMVAAGFTNSAKRDSTNPYRFVVTEPLEIEFPSSLSVVVKKWNQPMHDFLKKYVFFSWLRYGKFCAILATFLLSSLLHGLELKVSMVLISIGIFSYLQVAPRDRISKIFNLCVRVRPCKDCKHRFKRDSIIVRMLLLIYSFATVFHLAYLGVLMDPSTDKVGIYEKWQNLGFISHFIMLVNVLVIL